MAPGGPTPSSSVRLRSCMRWYTRGGPVEMTLKSIAGIGLLLAALSGTAQSQATRAHDPGSRPGASAGGPIDNLTPGELKLFKAGQATFVKVDTVSGDGLGPRMNLDSCAGCHAQPTVGGSGAKPNPHGRGIGREAQSAVPNHQAAGPE